MVTRLQIQTTMHVRTHQLMEQTPVLVPSIGRMINVTIVPTVKLEMTIKVHVLLNQHVQM